MRIVLEQGSKRIELEPLQTGQKVEWFYDYDPEYGRPERPMGIEREGVSSLFFFDGRDGLSLVVAHDRPDRGQSGAVDFEFSGLPEDGSWVVKDDPWDFDGDHSSPPEHIAWGWAERYTDGGAFRGGLDDDFDVTIEPAFDEEASKYNEGFDTVDSWQVLSGDANDPDRHELDKDEPIRVHTGQEISASVTTLQFIPGKSENPSEGGHPLNSGLMQIFPEDKRWEVFGHSLDVSADPVFDSWTGGDMKDKLPKDLEDAREKVRGKYLDDVGADPSFKQYRFENGVNVSFETRGDDGIKEDSVEIEFSEVGPSGDDPVISRGNQKNSKTVLHDHEINDLPWEEWYDGGNERRSKREPRYYEYDIEFKFDGVEGVRVVTVWGGWAGFMGDISERASDDPHGFLNEIWDWGLTREALAKLALLASTADVDYFIEAVATVPRTWTFLDFIVLADGRRYARVWDASQYPSLYTYMDGDRKARDDMAYETKQLWNLEMFAFQMLAMLGLTPYSSSPLTYYELFFTSPEVSPVRDDVLRAMADQIYDLGLDWTPAELLPTIPRVTLGFDANGEPVDDETAPFPSPSEMFFPTGETLPPN